MTKLEQMRKRAKSLKPEVSWIPRSEQEYLQRQKLMPVFQGWLNQIWQAQEKELNSFITEVWNEAIKECEGKWTENIHKRYVIDAKSGKEYVWQLVEIKDIL